MKRLLIIAVLLMPLSAIADTMCGYNVIGGSTAAGLNGLQFALAACTPPVNSIVTDLQVYVAAIGGGTGHINAAIYDSDGSGGAPGTVICQGTQQTASTANHWYVFPISGCGTLTGGHKYWMAENYDNSSISIAFDSAGGGHWYFTSQTCCTFTNMTSPTAQSNIGSIYLDLANSLTSCGTTNVLGSSSNSQKDVVNAAAKCIPSSNATVSDLNIFMKDASGGGNVNVAIYDSDGAAGVAKTLICQGTSSAVVQWAWNTFSMSGCGTLTGGHTYWLAGNVDQVATNYSEHSGTSGDASFQSQTCCTFSTLSSATSSNFDFAEYVDLNAPIKRHQVVTSDSTGYRNLFVPGNGITLPSMGWSPWRPYMTTATETNIENNCDALVSNGLLALGYKYCGVDENWATTRSGGSLVVNTADYPSGMAALGAYIHADGELFTMYLAPGPSGCLSFPTSQGTETADAAQIAGYGDDYLKYDDCYTGWTSNAQIQAAYTVMGGALLATGRPIQMLASMAQEAPNFYQQNYWCPSAYGNDVWTAVDAGAMTFTILENEVDEQAGLPQPGCWSIPDYLAAGNGTLTDAEGRANMSLWSILAAPLWIGIDLTSASSPTLATLKNAGVIAVDQDPLVTPGVRTANVSCGSALCQTFTRTIQAGGLSLVGWNRDSASHAITMSFTGTFNGYDLYAGSSLGSLTSSYTPTVASHDVSHIVLCPGSTNWNTGTNKCQ